MIALPRILPAPKPRKVTPARITIFPAKNLRRRRTDQPDVLDRLRDRHNASLGALPVDERCHGSGLTDHSESPRTVALGPGRREATERGPSSKLRQGINPLAEAPAAISPAQPSQSSSRGASPVVLSRDGGATPTGRPR